MTTASYESLRHAKWDGKYHVVFSPKGRKQALYGKSRGSALYVMLALRRSPREVVMAYEELDGADMVRELLGE